MARTNSPISPHQADAGEALEAAQHAAEDEVREARSGARQDAGRVLQDGEGARVEERQQPAGGVEEVDRVPGGRRVDDQEVVVARPPRGAARVSTAMYSALPASVPERFW